MEALANPDCGWLFKKSADSFKDLPSSAISYWLSSSVVAAFSGRSIADCYVGKEGVGTRNDDVFIKNTWEVSDKDISRDRKWIITDKAGGFQRWYASFEHVMDWENDGFRIKNYRDEKTGKLKSRPQNTDYLFKAGVSWGKVGSGEPSFRYRAQGFGFNDAAPTLFGNNLLTVLAYLNTTTAREFIKVQGETLNLTTGIVVSLPLPSFDQNQNRQICNLAESCIGLVQDEQSRFEISYEFSHHPLL